MKEKNLAPMLELSFDQLAAIYATVFVKLDDAFTQCNGDPEKIPLEGREYYRNLVGAYKVMFALGNSNREARILKGYE
jgi:hypothetical protein